MNNANSVSKSNRLGHGFLLIYIKVLNLKGTVNEILNSPLFLNYYLFDAGCDLIFNKCNSTA